MSKKHTATGDATNWAKRHRQQHEAALAGKPTALGKLTSRRFSAEFEHAVRQRGEQAKERSRGR